MNGVERISVAVLLVLVFAAGAHGQSGAEEQAIIAMATAKDVRALEQHLPEVVREQIAGLPASARTEVERALTRAIRSSPGR